ncbi:MAG: hypothetical protein Q9217_001374 [Psora testacea]
MPLTRASTRKKQTKLSFTPVTSSSPQRSFASIRVDETSSPTKKRRVGRKSSRDILHSSPFSKNKLKVIIQSPSAKPAQLPTPAPSSQVDVQAGLRNGADDEELDLERLRDKEDTSGQSVISSSEEEAPVAQSTRRRRPIALPLNSDNDVSEPTATTSRRAQSRTTSSSDSQTPKKSNSKSSRPRSAKSFILGGTSGAAPISHSLRQKHYTPSKVTRRTESRSITLHDSDSSFSGEETAQTLPKRNLRSAVISNSPRKVRTRSQPDLGSRLSGLESDTQLDPSSESSAPSPSAAIPGRNRSPSDPDVVSTPGSKRKNVRLPDRANAASQDAQGEASNLEDEVADLQGTEIRTRRTRGKPKASERSKRLCKLEELKRRRAGVIEIDDEEGDGGSREAEDLASETEYHLPLDSIVDLDKYDDDFVDDDGDQAIGVDLARGGVPLHMTQHNYLKPFEYFQYEVEWMVHNKVDPAFKRNDEVYELAHMKLDDEVKGHAGSTFKSSAWTQDFAYALMSRPEISRIDVPTMFEQKCDACNRSGHPPKHKLILTGSKYDKDTLEKLSTGDTDDDDSLSEVSTDKGHEQHFFLGRFCCANAEIAHALYHWRYQLNQTVLQWLAMEGHTTPEKIIERENWTRKKREKLANKIVDGMLERGEMRELYRQFKQNLDAARSAKVWVLAPSYETNIYMEIWH